jgi:acetyl esterase/lipase
MKKLKFILVVFTIVAFNPVTFGQSNNLFVYPPQIKGAKVVTYKSVDGIDLNLWIFNPPSHQTGDKKPVVVFFFGGGWSGGSPNQFVAHCEYLAARGMVAMVADYRVFKRNNVKVNKCVTDAKSSIRWVREHASELGIDPDKIVAGGGSAGGHLAAATALLAKFDNPSENLRISSKPNALVLFNPALVIAPVEGLNQRSDQSMEKLEERFGAKPESISPYHNIKTGLPPTIIFHGTKDSAVPFETVKLFAGKMKALNNKCTLVAYKDEPHGFFNYGANNNGAFIDTVNKMDQFLVLLGYLISPPEIEEFE